MISIEISLSILENAAMTASEDDDGDACRRFLNISLSFRLFKFVTLSRICRTSRRPSFPLRRCIDIVFFWSSRRLFLSPRNASGRFGFYMFSPYIIDVTSPVIFFSSDIRAFIIFIASLPRVDLFFMLIFSASIWDAEDLIS